jgi:hypothetical protein
VVIIERYLTLYDEDNNENYVYECLSLVEDNESGNKYVVLQKVNIDEGLMIMKVTEYEDEYVFEDVTDEEHYKVYQEFLNSNIDAS